jgi:prepilin-type processing-associated H-X9-DG protein
VLDNGGLPPCNTYAGNLDLGQSVDDLPGTPAPNGNLPWLGSDYQAPRISYTVNEALCPRNKFVVGFQNATVAYHYVRASVVKHSAQTILATEWNPDWHMVSANGENNQNIQVCKSHRPVSGFIDNNPAGQYPWDLSQPTPPSALNTVAAYRRVQLSDLKPNPTYAFDPSPQTTLDWVGRNHGNKGIPSDGTTWNENNSNFLYVDGHVETKNIQATIGQGEQWEWGDYVYSVQGGTSVSH